MEQLLPAGNRQKRIMGKLKDSIVANLVALHPSKTLAPHVVSHIEHSLHQLFPTSHLPTHPPYASMIQRAILELNEVGGSSEVVISEFILREFQDLPWGHESFLSHHLRKLCRSKDIVRTNDGRYMLPVQSSDLHDRRKRSRKRRQRCNDGYRLEKPNDVIEEGFTSQNQDPGEQCRPERLVNKSSKVAINSEKTELTGQKFVAAEQLKRGEEGGRTMTEEKNRIQWRRAEFTEVNKAERQLIEAAENPIEVQWKETETSCGVRQSTVKLTEEQKPQEWEDTVIREQSQLQEQQIGIRTNMVRSYHDAEGDGSLNTMVSCEESTLPMVEAGKQEKGLHRKSPSKQWDVIICCGLMARGKPPPKISYQQWAGKTCLDMYSTAQQRGAKPRPDKNSTALELQMSSEQQLGPPSVDKLKTYVNTNTEVSCPSDLQHHEWWPRKCQGRGRTPKHPGRGRPLKYPGRGRQPKQYGRGRPSKIKDDANMIMEGLLPSNHHHNAQFQQLGGLE